MQMDEFICRRNIEHYQKLLEAMEDGAQRRLVLELLAAEEAKLAATDVKESERPPAFRKMS